jgi:hypothetical protein
MADCEDVKSAEVQVAGFNHKTASFVVLHYFTQKTDPLMAIDTPG